MSIYTIDTQSRYGHSECASDIIDKKIFKEVIKLMKKIGIIILIVISLLLGVFFVYRWKASVTPDDGTAEKEMVEYFNDKVDFVLLLYGEGIDFPAGLKYEEIDSLSNENWQKDNDYVYLIINDLNGDTVLEKEKYLELLDYANKNTNFNFYYIGTDDLQMIKENTMDSNISDEDMSFGYIVYEGNRLMHLGLWTKNDHQYLKANPTLLSENICSGVLLNVKSNE